MSWNCETYFFVLFRLLSFVIICGFPSCWFINRSFSRACTLAAACDLIDDKSSTVASELLDSIAGLSQG